MNLMFDIDSNISFEKVDELNESTGKTEKKYKIKGIFSTILQTNSYTLIPNQITLPVYCGIESNFDIIAKIFTFRNFL